MLINKKHLSRTIIINTSMKNVLEERLGKVCMCLYKTFIYMFTYCAGDLNLATVLSSFITSLLRILLL